MPPSLRRITCFLAVTVTLALAACTSAPGATTGGRVAASSPPRPAVDATATATTTRAATPSSGTPSAPSVAPTRSAPSRASAPPSSPSAAHGRASDPSTGAGLPNPQPGAPVIVLDPGHSPTIDATDPANGLNVSDYENEPEMRDVFAVAQLVRARLLQAGYQVVLTKTSVDQRRTLLQRAQIADRAHASLALSIHDQAGSTGGIGFSAGNNTVYYQSTGTYRATASGHRVYFTDSALAAVSKRYGRIFQQQRARVEGVPITLLGDTGYDLGGRGLAGGDIWMVQLLSHVPWIYNESGGNSAGTVGLDAHDRQVYADALVAAVEHCIAPPR